jgi:hypothetical protein
MAANATPPNSITLPIPLLGILITLLLGGAGWATSLRSDVVKLTEWKEQHTKMSTDLMGEIRAKQAQQDKQRADDFAQLTAQNVALMETLTTVRIQLASKH